MTDEQVTRSDALYVSRLGALLAVDDLVDELVGTLDVLGVLQTTYVAFTSDHGYRFGQFGMPQGKWNAYENDLRIPFLIRGPGIAAGSRFDGLASNVDVMPTLLALAGAAQQPPQWDGRSAAPHLLGTVQRLQGWRTDLLIEDFAGGDVVRYEHLEDALNNSFRLLRRIDPAAPEGERDLSVTQFVAAENWNFTHPVPAAEAELFNLQADPFQMRNLYGTAPAALRDDLEATLSRLFACAGSACN